jgi:uncharacterized UPF0160 family protein
MLETLPRSFGTHNGSFHADEVTACALLLLFNLIDRDKIVRSRSPDELNSCEFVCDVGGIYNPDIKRFDHHQVDYKGTLSSAGMILKYLVDSKTITPEEFNLLNQTLIAGVDAHDNGIETAGPGISTYSMVIGNFAPIEHEASDEEWDSSFEEALDLALGHLKRLVARYRYILSCREQVKDAMAEKKPVLIFEKSIPWMDNFFAMNGESHPAKFVIMPSGKHWKLRGIPPSLQQRMQVRKPLPLEWAGLLGDELKKVTGIKGSIFCHKGRFISVWETKEDAIKALKLCLEES